MTLHSVSKRISHAVVPVVALLLSTSMWAADATPSAGRASIELSEPVKVAGTQLQSGKYRVEWSGAGNQVEVKIYRGKNEVVSTHARLIKDDKSYTDLFYIRAGENGARVLDQISFSKQKCALQLENDSNTDAQRAAK